MKGLNCSGVEEGKGTITGVRKVECVEGQGWSWGKVGDRLEM